MYCCCFLPILRLPPVVLLVVSHTYGQCSTAKVDCRCSFGCSRASPLQLSTLVIRLFSPHRNCLVPLSLDLPADQKCTPAWYLEEHCGWLVNTLSKTLPLHQTIRAVASKGCKDSSSSFSQIAFYITFWSNSTSYEIIFPGKNQECIGSAFLNAFKFKQEQRLCICYSC